MITTNPDIVNYDFYDYNNICVVDREDIGLFKIWTYKLVKYNFSSKISIKYV